MPNRAHELPAVFIDRCLVPRFPVLVRTPLYFLLTVAGTLLLSLAILGVYILVLFLLRKKLDSRFTLKVIGLLHKVAGRDQGQADGLVVSERLNGVNGVNGFNGVVDGLC